MMRISIAALVALLAACRAQPAPAPTTLAPCTVPVHEADSLGWREVSAEGFAFCVPGSWRASGDHGWRGEAGTISWGVGEYRPVTIGTTIGAARVPAGVMDAASPPLNRRATETIGGAVATLWDTEFQGSHLTGAKWEGKRVYLTGKAPGPRNADRHWAIYRTVHFVSTSGE